MEKAVKDDVLSILSGSIDILREKDSKDVLQLKELSNHSIHDASIYQDDFSVEIAVLVYALYKLLERGCQCAPAQYEAIVENFRKAKSALEREDVEQYKRSVQQVFKVIRSIDQRLKVYVQEVIEKARITKASKLFAHGLSLATAAKVMGIGQWELAGYVGKMRVLEEDAGGLAQKKRFEFALQLFSL